MTPAQGSIVVGVDGSEASRDALRWAVDEALLRDTQVRVVHAWWAYPMRGADDPRSAVNAFVTETFGSGLEVELEIESVQGRQASAALIDAARDADLLVVGSRGAGGFTGLLLGSVSQQCTDHAPCPVVIVRRRESDAKQP